MEFEKKIIKKYTELHVDRQVARNNFIKTLITVGSGFLALFIGLKSDTVNSKLSSYFFLITIILIVFGIIFSTLSMYLDIYYINDNQKFLKRILKEYMESGIRGDRLNITNKPWYFKFFEYIGFGSFLLAPISLVIYVYFIEFG